MIFICPECGNEIEGDHGDYEAFGLPVCENCDMEMYVNE